MPLVHLAIFIEHATPFMEEFLERLATLNYPHSRLRLFIHNNVSHACCDPSPAAGSDGSAGPAGGVPRAAHPELLAAPQVSVPERRSGRTRGEPGGEPSQNHGHVSLEPTPEPPRRGAGSAAAGSVGRHDLSLHKCLSLFVGVVSEACRKDPDCEFFFSLDSDVALTNPDTLRILMEENKYVVSCCCRCCWW